jgi:predicted DNA-binding protein (MmcQ/YjbR family)
VGFRDRERTGRELELIAGVGEICSGLPDVNVERDGFGHTSFRVAKKTFVMIGEGTHGQGSLSIKADRITQEALVRRGPYVRTPYIGQHGWVTLWGDAEVDWAEVRDLVEDAYRLAAPKRLRRRDARSG